MLETTGGCRNEKASEQRSSPAKMLRTRVPHHSSDSSNGRQRLCQSVVPPSSESTIDAARSRPVPEAVSDRPRMAPVKGERPTSTGEDQEPDEEQSRSQEICQ